MLVKFEFEGIEILVNWGQLLNALLPILVTFEGIDTEVTLDPVKAHCSIFVTL